MTNDELQWAINETLANVTKLEDCLKKTIKPVLPCTDDDVHGLIIRHLKNLMAAQYIRVTVVMTIESAESTKEKGHNGLPLPNGSIKD